MVQTESMDEHYRGTGTNLLCKHDARLRETTRPPSRWDRRRRTENEALDTVLVFCKYVVNSHKDLYKETR